MRHQLHTTHKWMELQNALTRQLCKHSTDVQALRFHVEQNQTGWVKALPKVHFDIMNTINASTSFTPFMLKLAHSPLLIPPLVAPENITVPMNQTPSPTDSSNNEPPAPTSDGEETVQAVINQLADDLLDVKDLLTTAKISQAHHANKDCSPDPTFDVGDHVLLATAHHRHEYMQAKDGHIAKFMPRFDGPFEVTHAYPDSSTYTLLLPEATKIQNQSFVSPWTEWDLNGLVVVSV